MTLLATTIGFIAGLLTTAANVPQVWKTYEIKSGEGLSFKMLLTLALGLSLWAIYGIMSKSFHRPAPASEPAQGPDLPSVQCPDFDSMTVNWRCNGESWRANCR